jgi:N-acetylglucosamine transport system permease protein
MTDITSTDTPPAVPRGGLPGITDGPTPARQAAARQRQEVNAFSTLAHIGLVIWTLVTLGPLIWVILASFKSNTEIFVGSPFALPKAMSFDSYRTAWSQAHVGRYFLNSVFVVTLSTAGTMLFGSMAAYVLARYKFFGNRFIYYMFVSGLAFPVFLAIVPLVLMLNNFGLNNTFTGLILVYIAYSLPFTVFFLAAFFKTLPNEIAEAATMDGASHTRLFFRVMVPMARSGLVSIAIFNIVGQWNQYLLPVAIMQGQGAEQKWVLTQGIAQISVSAGYQANWAALFAALTLSILPMIVVYAFFQRQIQAGLTAGAVK